ncbi:eukaryotic translation initiation factor 3 subunit A isoform X2 [Ischnura elegans]|uniref:eukaryotic translation initiation factor 3 subunit A isoform X2 n=1 Tax=Ischnura elegans TaxID=197161 RepID=UPI001ED86945|nr:eukaryotic translation initiation factor 3 subunit A isoform X2 [Ischnura elegans]
MARYGQRPENALKRANEFIEVMKPARALDTLYEVFRNKKWAYNWSESVLEPIMFKYLDLCVELKKSHVAKEGLFQYRNMFQSVNVGSLENVIRFYLRTAEERTEAAREQSQQAVVDIDDLDNLATPESILLSAVSGEDAQDRSDRTILTPWVKFLWESYCQCLELLRTNAHVETLYHDIARMTFAFCLKYNRKTEFRKLCDKLRKHLEDIVKLPSSGTNVSINKPETQQLNLETRLVQLESAIQMELWQEAYKAIEDIHGLMNLSKKMPVPKTMANYYQKLAMVFWKAGNYLFHAAALLKLFQLSREMKKNITPEEIQKMACRVLLATLSIPLPSSHPEFDRFIETDKSPLEKAQRLAVLLGLPQPPTRASLLRDMVRLNVVVLATPQLQDLHRWLEVEFHPLLLCSRVQTVIDTIYAEHMQQVAAEEAAAAAKAQEKAGGAPATEGEGEQPAAAPPPPPAPSAVPSPSTTSALTLYQYYPALKDVTLMRLIRQVSQVYQTIEFSRLLELARFTTPFYLERLLVECVRHNDMQIRIDHGRRCVHFGMDLSESQREDRPEGPTLQSMPSEQVRNQLVTMSNVLNRAMAVINPHQRKEQRDALRAIMVKRYEDTKIHEHQRILMRHKIIEDRKEYYERLNTVREEEEARRQEEALRAHHIAEQKRLEAEREERERKRQENEIQQMKDRHLKEKMLQISMTSHGQRVLKKLEEDDIKKLDADQIAAREAEELQKERKELQQKLKSQEKKVDYFERAKRLEEIPLLEKAFEEKQVKDRELWEQMEKERIQTLIEERHAAVQHRERLARMVEDKDAFLAKLQKERKAQYVEKLKEFEEKLVEEKIKRLAERKKEREEEHERHWQQQKQKEAEEKELAERLQRELEEKKRQEEREAAEALRREKEEEERRLMEEKRSRLSEDRPRDGPWRQSSMFGDRDRDRDRDRGRDSESKLSWRKKDDSAADDTADSSRGKTEAWRPTSARLREMEGGSGGAGRWDGERGMSRGIGDRGMMDRDRGSAFDRDGRGSGFGRDRDRPSAFDRDGRDGGINRFGDRDRGMEREGGRGFMERGGGSAFDREGGRGGGMDRERPAEREKMGAFDGERSFDRGAGMRDRDVGRDRPSDTPERGGGSWRSRPSQPEAEEPEDKTRWSARRGPIDRLPVARGFRDDWGERGSDRDRPMERGIGERAPLERAPMERAPIERRSMAEPRDGAREAGSWRTKDPGTPRTAGAADAPPTRRPPPLDDKKQVPTTEERLVSNKAMDLKAEDKQT